MVTDIRFKRQGQPGTDMPASLPYGCPLWHEEELYVGDRNDQPKPVGAPPGMGGPALISDEPALDVQTVDATSTISILPNLVDQVVRISSGANVAMTEDTPISTTGISPRQRITIVNEGANVIEIRPSALTPTADRMVGSSVAFLPPGGTCELTCLEAPGGGVYWAIELQSVLSRRSTSADTAAGEIWRDESTGDMRLQLGDPTMGGPDKPVSVRPYKSTKVLTVLTGPDNDSALIAGNGLAATWAGGPAFTRISFVDGFDESGLVEHIESFQWNRTVGGLDANSTNYIYFEREGQGVVQAKRSPLKPIYSPVEPTNPLEDQWWFDMKNYMFFFWKFNQWNRRQVVFAGQATTDDISVTEAFAYRYRGEYDSGWSDVVGGNQLFFLQHRLGWDMSAVGASVQFYINNTPVDEGAVLSMDRYNRNHGVFIVDADSTQLQIRTRPEWVSFDGLNWTNSGYLRLHVDRGF